MNKLKYVLLLIGYTSMTYVFAEPKAECKTDETKIKASYTCCSNSTRHAQGMGPMWVTAPKDCTYFGGGGWPVKGCIKSTDVAEQGGSITSACENLDGKISISE